MCRPFPVAARKPLGPVTANNYGPFSASIRAERSAVSRAKTVKLDVSTLATAILSLVTRGERDSIRLSHDALNAIAMEEKGEPSSVDAQVEKVIERRNAHDV